MRYKISAVPRGGIQTTIKQNLQGNSCRTAVFHAREDLNDLVVTFFGGHVLTGVFLSVIVKEEQQTDSGSFQLRIIGLDYWKFALLRIILYFLRSNVLFMFENFGPKM